LFRFLEETHGAKVKKFTLQCCAAYGCHSIGGIATLVGTSQSFFCQDFEIIYPNAPEISFGQWLIFRCH
jgi:sodium-dependent dicarboxylate transporter 2/3/5